MPAQDKTLHLGNQTKAEAPPSEATDPGLMNTGVALDRTQANPKGPATQKGAARMAPVQKTVVSPGGVPQAANAPRPAPFDDGTGATIVQELAATMASRGGPAPLSVPKHSLLEHELLGGPQPGKIDRFVILRKLGEGGMGMVFSAFDEDLDRRVAIKLLLDEGEPGTQGRARIRREAQAMAKLNHPNVVQVYEVGDFRNQLYVVMEFVRGQTLGDWTTAEERSWRDILEMHIQAGRGLAAAHAVGLIHRDFKPDNVLVGDDGRARVLDFGLARAAVLDEPKIDPGSSIVGRVRPDRRAEINTELTTAGTIMGTPAYMSPEQHKGDPTDARSDQFSFCVALYEAMYGYRPFSGDTYLALSEAVMAGELIPPPKSTTVPAGLYTIIRRGLSPNPADRFESIDTLLAELAHAIEPEAIGGFLQSRWRWPVITAVTTGIAVLVTTALMYGGAPTPEEEQLVNQLAREAREAASEAHWVYPAIDAPEDTSLRKVKALEELEGAAEDLGRERAAELRETFASTLKGLGNRYWENKSSRPFAADYYLQALMFDPDDPELLARAEVSPAYLYAFRQKALVDGFSSDELRSAQVFEALAESDQDLRDQKLLAIVEALDVTSLGPLAAIDELSSVAMSEPARKQLRSKARRRASAALGLDPDDKPKEVAAPPEPEVVAPPEVVDEPEPAPEPAPTKVRKPKPKASDGDAKKPPAKAPDDETPEQIVDEELSNSLAEEGQKALDRGDLKRAESLFKQSLSANNRNAMALIGLSDVYFERGSYRKAVQYAEKAVRISASAANYWIKLGDAYFKLLRFADARRAYEKAKKLGSGKADGRLSKVREQLGE
ncbi:MAG: protein kinase [Myxococcales bacterium]|nr:protein kinase [Myxococcales bacterium]